MTDGTKVAEIQSHARRRARSRLYFSIFLIAIIAIAFIIFVFFNLFNIKRVNVSGIADTSPYTAADVELFLEIGDSTNLITYDTERSERALLYEFPYIGEVNIKKSFPSTLEISITEKEGTLYTKLGEDVFILSSDAAVLEITDGSPEHTQGRAELIISGIKRCVCGETLVFENENMLDILSAVMTPMDKYGLTEKVTRLDLTNKFDVRIVYDNRFDIKLGTFEDMENKLKLFYNMLISDKNNIWKDSSGTVDLTNASKALVKFN